MEEPSGTMKCPFRQKDGDFLPCYGAACMAYFEYTPAPIAFGQTNSVLAGQTPVPMCRKMLAYVPYTCGCV